MDWHFQLTTLSAQIRVMVPTYHRYFFAGEWVDGS
jgi:hypothetical protein